MYHIVTNIIDMVIALRQKISYHQVRDRYRGICSKESLKIRKLTRQLTQLILMHHIEDNIDINPPFIYLYHQYRALRYERIPNHIPNVRKDLRFIDINPYDSWDLFRFKIDHLQEIVQCLLIPERIVLTDGNVVSGEEGLMVLLYRLSRPRTYVEIVRMFGRNVSLWCKVHNFMINHVFMTFHHLVHNNLEYFYTKFHVYNQKIREFITNRGDDVPIRNVSCVGFVDGKKVSSMC